MTTENELLEITNHFKELIEKKNNEIIDLKKLIFKIYGLICMEDECIAETGSVEFIRSLCSEAVEEMIS